MMKEVRINRMKETERTIEDKKGIERKHEEDGDVV